MQGMHVQRGPTVCSLDRQILQASSLSRLLPGTETPVEDRGLPHLLDFITTLFIIAPVCCNGNVLTTQDKVCEGGQACSCQPQLVALAPFCISFAYLLLLPAPRMK